MTIKDTELAAAAAMFPPVSEVCPGCNGEGSIVVGLDHISAWVSLKHEKCPNCEGIGLVHREMTKREEHSYLMILIQEKVDAD